MIPVIAHLLTAFVTTLLIFATSGENLWVDVFTYWLFHGLAFVWMFLCGGVAVLVSWVFSLRGKPGE